MVYSRKKFKEVESFSTLSTLLDVETSNKTFHLSEQLQDLEQAEQKHPTICVTCVILVKKVKITSSEKYLPVS